MPATGPDIIAMESRLARRLGLLFRGERKGSFARHSLEFARLIIRRRGALIDALTDIEAARRSRAVPLSPELSRAAEELWLEIGRSRHSADARVDRLRADLRAVSGEGALSGIRNTASGRLIGRG